MTKLLEDRVKELEDKLVAIEHEKLLKTYRYCEGCRTKKPPQGFRSFKVGPCGLTDYYRTEHICPECSVEYKKSYKEL